jgi:hypothetical protein
MEAYAHSVIGSRFYRIGKYPSEWFRVSAEGWDFISAYLDRASDEIGPGDSDEWIEREKKVSEEQERLAEEEDHRIRQEAKQLRKQFAESILQRLSPDERKTIENYFAEQVLEAFERSYSISEGVRIST